MDPRGPDFTIIGVPEPRSLHEPPSAESPVTPRSFALLAFLTPAMAPLSVGAQDEAPAGLTAVEVERSRACVPILARLETLNRDLEPLSNRAIRIQQLDQAIALEDSASVAPLDTSDPLETAVGQWFTQDANLGRRWAETQDSTVLTRRREARTELRQRLRDELQVLTEQGQARVATAGDIQAEAQSCQGAIFVRPVVVEACAGSGSELCQAAADTAAGPFRFVAAAEDLWNVEELRPWTQPGPLQILPEGSLGGARSTVRARRGNVQVSVALSPMIRERTDISAEQAAEFDANLDSLGFTFEHPRFVMAPAFEVQLVVERPLGGETHYMLHFGDLSDPPSQVVWSVPASQTGPIQAAFPAAPGALARLTQGQTLNLTAVALGEDTGEGAEADVVYSIPMTGVNQTPSLEALLGYMAGGQLGQDLARLVPPTSGGG